MNQPFVGKCKQNNQGCLFFLIMQPYYYHGIPEKSWNDPQKKSGLIICNRNVLANTDLRKKINISNESQYNIYLTDKVTFEISFEKIVEIEIQSFHHFSKDYFRFFSPSFAHKSRLKHLFFRNMFFKMYFKLVLYSLYPF